MSERQIELGQPKRPKIKHLVIEINGVDVKLTLTQAEELYEALGDIFERPHVEVQEEKPKENKTLIRDMRLQKMQEMVRIMQAPTRGQSITRDEGWKPFGSLSGTIKYLVK